MNVEQQFLSSLLEILSNSPVLVILLYFTWRQAKLVERLISVCIDNVADCRDAERTQQDAPNGAAQG